MKRKININRASKLLNKLEVHYIKKAITENIEKGECEYTPLTSGSPSSSLQTATRMLWAYKNIRDQFDLNIVMVKGIGKKYKFFWKKPVRFQVIRNSALNYMAAKEAIKSGKVVLYDTENDVDQTISRLSRMVKHNV